jgi:hypothetical protein
MRTNITINKNRVSDGTELIKRLFFSLGKMVVVNLTGRQTSDQ